MGTEAIWIPLVLAAAGGTASAVNARNVAKKNEQIQARGIAAQARRQEQADARISDEIRAQNASTPEEERAEALGQFTDTLRNAKASAEGGGDVPMGSDRYQTESVDAKADIQDYGGKLADIVSRINAPLRQRENEAQSRNRTASDVAGIARNAEGDAWLTQLMASSVTPNTGLSIAAPLLQGAASATAGGMGPGPASSASLAQGQRAGMQSVMQGIRGARRVPIVI